MSARFDFRGSFQSHDCYVACDFLHIMIKLHYYCSEHVMEINLIIKHWYSLCFKLSAMKWIDMHYINLFWIINRQKTNAYIVERFYRNCDFVSLLIQSYLIWNASEFTNICCDFIEKLSVRLEYTWFYF